MMKRTTVYLVLALVLLISAACLADKEITYSGPFVTVNSPLKLCATATDNGDPVSGVGLWFQAWTLAGIPRTNGPMSTVYTNSLGKACNLFNLNEDLYEVQAFGTDGFDGVASEPVVVSNWKTNGAVEATSAGIATYRLGYLGPTCDAAFGLQIDHGFFGSIRTLNQPGQEDVVSQSPRSPVTFLWLDECNPAGPIRIEIRNYDSTSITQARSGSKAEILMDFSGYTWVTLGGMTSLMWTEFSVHSGPGPRLQPIGADEVCLANGTFELLVLGFSGRTIYDVSGSFKGTACTFFPPP